MHGAGRKAAPGKLRIIAGTLRGSRLPVEDVAELRPTPDRVRETLFNWLAPFIAGARCLDLFAGTGALGVEALSRGAAHVDFVEYDAQLAERLRANLVRLKQTAASVRCADALRALDEFAQPYDIVFLDPPFAGGLWQPAANALQNRELVVASGLIYVEAPTTATLALPPTWQLYRESRAGAVRAMLYRRVA